MNAQGDAGEHGKRERHETLARIFDEATKLAAADRLPFLDRACAEDSRLREDVDKLLALEPELDSFDHGIVQGQLRELGRESAEHAVPEDSEDWLPETIGSYRILGLIGRGNMGVVLEAAQELPSRRVALKLIHPLLATEAALRRLRKEAEFLGRLHHPGIAQIYEAGLHELNGQTQPYFAMEYIDGLNLLAHANERDLKWRSRMSLVLSLCDAVQHAHEQGVIHRDLKPDNIVVDALGQPKLLDFGVARLLEEADREGTLRTRAGDLLGTLAYMAPEQAAGDPNRITPRTDVFALGVIAFELLSGRIPRQLQGLSIAAAVEAVGREEPIRLREVQKSTERDLDTVIGKALEFRPSQRYSSALDFGADLRRVLERRPIVARPPSRYDRALKYVRRHRLQVTSFALVAASLLVALFFTGREALRESQRRMETLTDLYASEMLRVTDASGRAHGLVKLDESLSRWVPQGGEPDLRGWEWRFLDGVRQDDTPSVPLPGIGMAVDWHPSGNRIAVASPTTIEIFDVETRERIHEWQPQGKSPFFLKGLRYSPDGERLLFHGWDVIGVKQAESSAAEWMLEGEGLHAGAWYPDGASVLATSKARRSAIRFDAWTGEEIEAFPETGAALEFRNITADGQRTGSLGAGTAPAVLDLRSGALGPYLRASEQIPMSLMFSPSGEQIAESGWSNIIRVFNVSDSKMLVEIREHNEQVDVLDWHPKEALIATGGGDASVRVYSSTQGALMELLRGHRDRVVCVRWNPLGTMLASVSDDRTLRLWDMTAKRSYRRRALETDGVLLFDLQLDFREGGQVLHGSHRYGAFEVRFPKADVVELPIQRTLETVSPDGVLRSFVRPNQAGFEAVVLRSDSGEEIWTSPAQRNEPTVHSWHPSSRKLLLGTAGRGFELVDFSAEPVSLWAQPAHDRVGGGDFDWTATRAVLLDKGAPVRIVDIESGDVLTSISLPEGPAALAAAFSPARPWVSLCCSDGDVRIYDAESGTLEARLVGHSGKVLCAGWHPSEPRLATGSADGSVKLWNTDSFAPTATFDCGGAVKALSWDSSGRLLVAMTATGLLHFWEAPDQGGGASDSAAAR